MTSPGTANLTIDEITETLINFSIDRSDMQNFLCRFPTETTLNRTTIEYEIQILRILGTGWSINYFVHDKLLKKTLSESYWNSIKDFSHNLSTISSATMSKNFNYFDVIKQRLDEYLAELNIRKNMNEPTEVIGPKFAELCGHPENAVVVWLGSKMFQSVLYQIQTYLSGIQFIKNDNSIKKQPETKK